jgi:hypothetical protein
MPAEPAYTVVERSAVISPCGTYRYRLDRTFAHGEGDAVFIMLNPSTADGTVDDPTIRRCMGFAAAWGHRRLIVVNLFAFRSPSPKDLLLVADPVGPENEVYLEAATRPAARVICAWGKDGSLLSRSLTVRQRLAQWNVPALYLGLTKAGEPRHPLYMAGATLPQPWVVAGAQRAAAKPLPGLLPLGADVS